MEIKIEYRCNECNSLSFIKGKRRHFSMGKLCNGIHIEKKWVAVDDVLQWVKSGRDMSILLNELLKNDNK